VKHRIQLLLDIELFKEVPLIRELLQKLPLQYCLGSALPLLELGIMLFYQDGSTILLA
jgi:hypothetical protein